MGGLFGPAQAPTLREAPVIPSLSSADVQAQTNEDLRRRALAQGRASTLITNPGTQLSPDASRAKTALGGL